MNEVEILKHNIRVQTMAIESFQKRIKKLEGHLKSIKVNLTTAVQLDPKGIDGVYVFMAKDEADRANEDIA